MSGTEYVKPDAADLDLDVRTALQRHNHWLEPAEVDRLVDAYAAGANLSDLGKQFKVHRTTARRHLLGRGIALRSAEPSVSNEVAEAWVRLYESGVSTTKLAAQFDTYPNTVRRVPLAQGVRMRSSGKR